MSCPFLSVQFRGVRCIHIVVPPSSGQTEAPSSLDTNSLSSPPRTPPGLRAPGSCRSPLCLYDWGVHIFNFLYIRSCPVALHTVYMSARSQLSTRFRHLCSSLGIKIKSELGQRGENNAPSLLVSIFRSCTVFDPGSCAAV